MSTSSQPESDLILGIDLGTTTVKICVINSKSKDIVFEKSKKTDADIFDVGSRYVPSSITNFDGFSEQDVRKIWSTLNSLLDDLDSVTAGRITAVGVCGQQHGIILWNESSCRTFTNPADHIPRSCAVSNLITWQDQRCGQAFRDGLPKPDPPEQVLATGYGAVSLFWLDRNAPSQLHGFDRSGTIMDFVAWLIVRQGTADHMSEQNAETWGYYDRFKHSWNTDILNKTEFPVGLLPKAAGGKAPFVGHLRTESPWHGITGQFIPVGVAFGDLQCSFLASVQNAHDAVLNFSTSSQISFIRTRTDLPIPASCDVRTYFSASTSNKITSHSGREMIVAPSLNGGNVLTFFVQTVQKWMETVGATVTEQEIWAKIVPLANEKDWIAEDHSDPSIKPTLYGERYDTAMKASVRNISLVNCDLGSVVRGILKGVVVNLETMLQANYLRQSGVTRIVLTGSLFKTFPHLVGHVEKVFGLPVVVKDDTRDAAYGAALAMSDLIAHSSLAK